MVVLLAAGLTGCLGADDAPAEEPGVERAEFSGSTGGIEGVVIDNAVQPISGANVTVQETGDVVRAGDAGAFALSNLAPGQHTLVASAPGFHSVQKQVAVRAGEVVTVEFTLTRVTVQAPYVDKLEFNGFQECATLVGYDLQNETGREGVPYYFFLGYSWCSTPNGILGGNATNDRFLFVFRVSPGVQGMVLEAEWQPSNPTAGSMVFPLEAVGFSNNNNLTFAEPAGESPLRAVVTKDRIADVQANLTQRCDDGNDNACINYADNGGDVQLRSFPWWTGCLHPSAGVCNNVQQKYTAFVSVFYHQEAPSDYTVRGGV